MLSDLQLYDQWSSIPFSNLSYINGPWTPGNNGESLLDIQLISAVAQTPTAYITIADGWAYGMAQQIFSLAKPPMVNSVSYGWPEALTCQSYVTRAHCVNNNAKAYVQKAEIELQKAGARGISFSVCSQDEGAPSENNMYCSLDNTQPVWPIYPGCSAFVTSVSGTTLVTTDSKSLKANASSIDGYPPICQMGYPCSTGSLEVPCSVANTYYQWTTG